MPKCTCEHNDIEDLNKLNAKMDAKIMFSYDNISDVIVVKPDDDNRYKIIGNSKLCKKHQLMVLVGLYSKGKVVYYLP